MSHVDVKSCVESAGLPCVHMAWPVGSAPDLPWCAFYVDEGDGFYADGLNYAGRTSWVVELYQRSRDASIESALESALSERFGPFRKTEAWVASEGCVQTSYYFTQVD